MTGIILTQHIHYLIKEKRAMQMQMQIIRRTNKMNERGTLESPVLDAMTTTKKKKFASGKHRTLNSVLGRRRKISNFEAKKDDYDYDDDDDEFETKVIGMTGDPCDEFSCTGTSPACEQTLREVANDFRRCRDQRRSIKPYARQFEFEDGVKRFRGAEQFARARSSLEKIFDDETVEGRVMKIEVVQGSKAEIVWMIKSKDERVTVTSVLDLNLITGKILGQRDTWRGQSDGLEMKRKALAVADNVNYAIESVSASFDKLSDSLWEKFKSSGEDTFAPDPNDPMKFFQEENNQSRNLSEFALLASVIFLISKLYEQVLK